VVMATTLDQDFSNYMGPYVSLDAALKPAPPGAIPSTNYLQVPSLDALSHSVVDGHLQRSICLRNWQ
jgi:hypothetical protein